MRLVIGSDHAGWPLKQAVIDHIHSLGHEVVDVGSYDEKPVDFPDIARAVAKKVTSGDVARGIMVCGTGVGASIAANKMKGIRAAVCHDVHSAHQCVEHDDVNVMCIGAQIVGAWLANDLISSYLSAEFSTDEDFRRRVEKLRVWTRKANTGVVPRMILVFGSLNIDLVAQVPVIAGPGRTVLAPSYATHCGGKGANQAVAAARIAGLEKIWMAGCVGRDSFGDEALQNLAANGVDTGLIVRAGEPTGCAFITVDPSGENSITVASGANMAASAADLPASLFSTDTVVVLQMEVPFAQSLEVARRTKSASGTVIWNLAPVPEQMTSVMVRDLLAATDYLLVNEHEALDAAAAIGVPVSGFEAAADELARAGELTCVVTAGAQGAFAVTASGDRLRARTPNITPVDTTGAGDTFVGAFASMLGEQASLQKAMEVGCEAAALKCLQRGAQQGMPIRDAIKSITPCDG